MPCLPNLPDLWREWRDKQWINDSPVLGYHQALDPLHVLNGTGIAAVHGAPSKRPYDQQGRLLPIVLCHLGPQQHVVRQAPANQVYKRLFVFLDPQ
jgi:hypothetical protein